MSKKRLNSPVYTLGRMVRCRMTEDSTSGTLYSYGRYKTKIKVEDLPEDYIKCHARVFWYLFGFVKTSGVKSVAFTYCKENHVFKDDYLYIGYQGPLVPVYSEYLEGYICDYKDGEHSSLCVDGSDIVRLVLAIEKYSPDVDTSEVRRLIDEKIEYLRTKETDYYKSCFNTTEKIDIFELWGKDGY